MQDFREKFKFTMHHKDDGFGLTTPDCGKSSNKGMKSSLFTALTVADDKKSLI